MFNIFIRYNFGNKKPLKIGKYFIITGLIYNWLNQKLILNKKIQIFFTNTKKYKFSNNIIQFRNKIINAIKTEIHNMNSYRIVEKMHILSKALILKQFLCILQKP